jgi:hypothetical protein
MTQNIPFRRAASLWLAALFFVGCSGLESRPNKQMAYAEASYQASMLANAPTNPEAAPIFQLARDQLARARSFYRLKNFRQARVWAVRSRRLFEEAEWRALRGGGSKPAESLIK